MSKLSHNGPVEETHCISRMLYLFLIKKKLKTKKKTNKQTKIQTNTNRDISCLSSELENLQV